MSTRRATRASDSNDGTSSTSSRETRDGKLPLPDDYFRTPNLNNKETKYLINLAKRACKEVVFYSRRSGGPMQWFHLASDDGVELYQGIDENSTEVNKSVTFLRGATRIYATIDEIADFFRLDTPMKLSGFTQTVGKDVLDQQTLYDLAMPTPENPKHYVGVKWTAVESPSKLARNRDFCYLECHDEFIDTNGKKRGWVRSIHSIRLPFCPPLDKSYGLVRGSLYRSGFVFIESDDKSYVDAVHTLHMDVKGHAPNWLKIMVMKRRIKNISEVNRYFQMRRLCEGRLLSDLELPSKSGISKCQLCTNRFGLFSRKSACRKCGKVICSPCGHYFLLDYAGVGAKKVRICTNCAEHVVQGTGLENQSLSHIGGHRLDAVPHPIYDQSPSTRGARSLSRVARQQSAEEREYYRNNEDASGMADIEEAKRMDREFEDLLSRSQIAQQQAQQQRPTIAPPKPTEGARGRRQSQRNVTYDIPEGSRRKAPERVSAYQEFLKNERARQKSIGAQVVGPSRNTIHRKSLIHTGAPAPGELLSRARQKKTQGGPQRLSSNSSELEFQLPPPHQDNVDEIRLPTDYEPDYEYPLHHLRDNHSLLSDDMVGAPIRRSDLSVGRSSRESVSEAFHASEVDRAMLPDDVASRDQPLSYPSPTSTDSHPRNGSTVVRNQRPPNAVKPSPRFDRRGEELQQFRRCYFDARNSGIKELEERVQSQPSTDDEGDFRYGYDATSSPSEDNTDKEYEVPVSEQSSARSTHRNTVPEEPRASSRNTVTELATVMALSAMQLYEKENGLDMQVSEETRQTALKKMIEIYSNEIDRSADEHHLADERTRHSASFITNGDQRDTHRVGRQHAQTVMGNTPSSAEYRDLSDLSTSAFKAYQKGPSQPRSDAESSLSSNTHAKSRNAPPSTDTQSHAASTTHRGSLPNADALTKLRSPVRDDVSDSFSDLDLIDLPHLMRADEVTYDRPSIDNRLSQDSHNTVFSELSSTRPSIDNRLSQDSHNTVFSELSSARDSTHAPPRLSELSASAAPNRSSYASLHANPGVHSPPSPAQSDSLSSLSDDNVSVDEGDVTSRTKMTQSELERYRASLADLMAEYNLDLDVTNLRQPEREQEPEKRADAKGSEPSEIPRQDMRQELYL